MLVFDDLEQKKIRIYDKNFQNNVTSNDDTLEPKFSSKEGLLVMAEDFINSITNGQEPLSDSNLGLEVVKILEASQKSIKNNGEKVFL
jgi:predicted dehydrogenase